MTSPTTRRGFLSTSSTAIAGAALAGSAVAQAATQAIDQSRRVDELRVGLIGAGGRGGGAAVQALRADPGARLVAIGDAFRDRIEGRLGYMRSEKDIASRIDVPPERQFAGFDNYQKVLEQDLDVVVLATSPHFRPQHLQAAIDKGVHVFCEKPVAVDAPGVRSVLASCAQATERNLSVVSGLCYRYHDGRRAILQQIHDGNIGQITSMNANYITGELWHRGENPEWSQMEYQMRNWLYHTWLSGDLITEQHVHSLDVMAWAMRDKYPTSAISMGGRQKRVDPKYGHIFDHFATVYDWGAGVKGYSFCRQQNDCATEVSDHIVGTSGRAEIFRHKIYDHDGKRQWKWQPERRTDMYQNEHDQLFAAVRAGNPINNGEYMAHSTLMAIMGRMAAYTGNKVTWEDALQSKESLTPSEYAWGNLATADVAVPGLTKFS